MNYTAALASIRAALLRYYNLRLPVVESNGLLPKLREHFLNGGIEWMRLTISSDWAKFECGKKGLLSVNQSVCFCSRVYRSEY